MVKPGIGTAIGTTLKPGGIGNVTSITGGVIPNPLGKVKPGIGAEMGVTLKPGGAGKLRSITGTITPIEIGGKGSPKEGIVIGTTWKLMYAHADIMVSS